MSYPDRVLIVAQTQDRLDAVVDVLRKSTAYPVLSGVELLAVHGLEAARAQLDQYLDLVILNYLGQPAQAGQAVLAGIREEYPGPLLMINDDAAVDACTWGRRYAADFHAAAIDEVPACVDRVLSRERTAGKAAIVLAGGGILGGFNAAGSLKALYDYGIRSFDMYVGLSAGAWVASLAANGLTPELMIEHPDLGPRDFYHLNRADIVRQAMMFGPNLLRAAAQQLLLPDSDWLFQLSSVVTTSPLSTNRLRQRFLDVLEKYGGTNDFVGLRERGVDLFVMAVDLDSAERRLFGLGKDVHVPICDAVMASAALPLFYRPVRIDGRDYVDGGIARSACIDTAIEQGADLIVCVNPLVPYTGGKPGYIQDLGLAGIAEQCVRTLIQSRLHAMVRRYRQMHPTVTIVLIEPDTTDPAMFHNPLRSSEEMIRLAALEGFRSTKALLEQDSDFIERVFANHGRPIDRTGAFVSGAGPYVKEHDETGWDDPLDAQELA